MIPVTRPFFPSFEKYQQYLEGVWKRQWLTNNGPLVNELEIKVAEFLDSNSFIFMGNGTIALQIAIKALGLKGEVITTPFSYVATSSTIVWEGCTPVFVDIDPNTYNINPSKIEEAITPQTSAILATHVFGNPCDTVAIDEIAKKYNLRVIYDGAHAFGVKYKGRSLMDYGDVTTLSTHATKIFHTVEGGGVFTNDVDLFKKISLMRNFGHSGPDMFSDLGINGKNSEVHAAMGLAVLPFMEKIFAKRKVLFEYYNKNLENFPVRGQVIDKNVSYNYSYFPILFDDPELMRRCIHKLNRASIFPRRYFYPSLASLPYVNNSKDLPITNFVTERILCLPLYHDLSVEEIDLVCRIMYREYNN
ncbi:dTDP-4-amino-4,6-dideoxygalactose transaminase [Algoriphagus locisalis]|uniref:dTDP-4-amino-4,6-dideoxygalactose transaminase n=1 Tax=Algoriphagus locisalis TaxID=305507 RepID=A0A1I6XN00_9BACT|nr:DegT/DnrJ/EryC1/StrS family aminotransferase [Algoriphagus locisalis]SFT39755.1 dTDP-4-amino-4,6-dideoxygalactose transaminase [Algoriphagus locisalis]